MGLLAQQVWARDPDDIGKRARRTQLPISQKESQKWLHSLDAVYTARDCCPTTHIISVGDREADGYNVLAAPRPVGVDLLIRAAWNRCVNAPQRYVWDTVAAQPLAAHLVLHVPRRGPQPARQATLALRYCPVTVYPPQHRKAERLPSVALWVVQAFAPFLGYLWCFTRLFVKAPAGRSRFNVLGAIHAISHELITVTNESYINAQSVCELLWKIYHLHLGIPITLVLDNARYQKCALVFDFEEYLGIDLLHLPPYSLNLNIIERL